MLTVEPHPLLDARAFITRLPERLGAMPTPESTTALFVAPAQMDPANNPVNNPMGSRSREESKDSPLHSDDRVRKVIRDLLRHGGFKPSGRSKPSSEYLIKAAESGRLSTINLAVDVCNTVSLHSGLPISVVDLGKLEAPLRLAIAEPGASYEFNPSGQVIDVGKLLCLIDAVGPCANAVKDAQRTKTDEATTSTLTVIWGSNQLAGHSQAAFDWCTEQLRALGANLEQIV